jgi:hypothetical protein
MTALSLHSCPMWCQRALVFRDCSLPAVFRRCSLNRLSNSAGRAVISAESKFSHANPILDCLISSGLESMRLSNISLPVTLFSTLIFAQIQPTWSTRSQMPYYLFSIHLASLLIVYDDKPLIPYWFSSDPYICRFQSQHNTHFHYRSTSPLLKVSNRSLHSKLKTYLFRRSFSHRPIWLSSDCHSQPPSTDFDPEVFILYLHTYHILSLILILKECGHCGGLGCCLCTHSASSVLYMHCNVETTDCYRIRMSFQLIYVKICVQWTLNKCKNVNLTF